MNRFLRSMPSLAAVLGMSCTLGLSIVAVRPVAAQYLVTSFENQGDLFTPINDPPLPGTPTVALSSQSLHTS